MNSSRFEKALLKGAGTVRQELKDMGKPIRPGVTSEAHVEKKLLSHLRGYASDYKATTQRLEEQGFYDAAAEFMSIDGTVLELGSGHGNLMARLPTDQTRIGIDNNPYLLESAYRRLSQIGPVNSYASGSLHAAVGPGVYILPDTSKKGDIIIPYQANLVLDDFFTLPRAYPLSVIRSAATEVPYAVFSLPGGVGSGDTFIVNLLQGGLRAGLDILPDDGTFYLFQRLLPVQDPTPFEGGIHDLSDGRFHIARKESLGQYTETTSRTYGLISTSRTMHPTFNVMAYELKKRR